MNIYEQKEQKHQQIYIQKIITENILLTRIKFKWKNYNGYKGKENKQTLKPHLNVNKKQLENMHEILFFKNSAQLDIEK